MMEWLSSLSGSSAHSVNSFICLFVCLFDLILYVPSTTFQLNRNGSSRVEASQVKYALFRHKQIHVSRPHMGDMATEKCITSKT